MQWFLNNHDKFHNIYPKNENIENIVFFFFKNFTVERFLLVSLIYKCDSNSADDVI